MLMEQLCKTFEYKISEGSEYQWSCYGPNARFLDFDNEYSMASVIFDSKNQRIYQAEVWIKNSNDNPYRWVHPDYVNQLAEESKSKGVDNTIAFDNVKFIVVDVEEDFLEKATAIWNNLPFDKRLQVPIDEDVFYDLAKLAHERDITVNKLVENILTELIEREKNEI